MKKCTLFLMLFATGLVLHSQITITADDMPDIGDGIRQSMTLSTSGTDYTLTGADTTWDFTNLGVTIQQVDTFVSVQSTPLIYQLVFFYPLVATIASPGADFDLIPGLVVTQVYEFFKQTSSAFSYAGIAATLNDIPLPIKYDNPDVLYKFPLNYGAVDSSHSAFEFGFSGLGYYSTDRHRKNTVDGWGTLSTPYGTFETLRLKSEVQQNDSLYVDTLGIGFPISRNYIEYKWLGNGFHIPLLQVTEEGLVTTVTYIDSLRYTVSVAEPEMVTGKMYLYPNPCNDILQIRLENCSPGSGEILIFNEEGKKIGSWPATSGNQNTLVQTINIREAKIIPGVYILILRNDQKIYVEKLIVN